jgi:hypothetical protein
MKKSPKPVHHIPLDELYALAAPPVGEPEALPAHLAVCRSCGRAFQTIQKAFADVGRSAELAAAERTPLEWNQAERNIMAKVRGLGIPMRRPRPRRRRAVWGGLAAASVLLVVWIARTNLGSGGKAVRMAAGSGSAASMSPADQADDKLLRDVARLSEGGEPSPDWKDLAPLPARSSVEGNS